MLRLEGEYCNGVYAIAVELAIFSASTHQVDRSWQSTWSWSFHGRVDTEEGGSVCTASKGCHETHEAVLKRSDGRGRDSHQMRANGNEELVYSRAGLTGDGVGIVEKWFVKIIMWSGVALWS